jgi:uncharacterized integral membrane protein (TIGR00698 family)
MTTGVETPPNLSAALLRTTSLDSMEGLPALAPGAADLPPGRRIAAGFKRLAPGLGIALLVAMAATWLGEHYGAPIMLFALLLGMALNFLSHIDQCRPGIDFASRGVLRLGVALLGATITLDQVASLGLGVLAVVLAAVLLTIAGGWLGARLLKLDSPFGLLTGGAVAICGASAALALSAVLPASPTRQRDTILTVVGVTTLSTLAMVVYPLLATALRLGEADTGVFLGATIHDVAQVVGAGYGVSKPAGDTATIVKLFRVAMLLPTALVIAMMFRGRSGRSEGLRRRPLLPGFLIAFVALVALNSTMPMPIEFTAVAGEASRWCLVTAIAGLGVKTALGDFVHVGWKPAALIVAETLFVMILVLTLIMSRASG